MGMIISWLISLVLQALLQHRSVLIALCPFRL
jgi:hypothetical protein